ncbi:late control protein D [Jiella endophytica]|uniref:Late control protein D n=1 Tax=Jiella endophytica TaxID=2558362 RepID=A0A4Y8RGI4_9HYPH|nr:contractile injection system protein, VgrG/Pvc8 family [Jiella endophytica]TFF20833.1 late control protein D [Jiella endophytica]
MTPSCRITVDGQPVSGVFQSRIISCEVTDKEGVSSDTCSIVLNDWPCAAIPRTGAIIRIWMGYGVAGMAYMGAYTAEEIEVEILPYRMAITGKAAEMRGKTKQHRERHWDDKTVEEVVSEIAGEHGLTPKIDPEIGKHKYEWLGQLNESDIHFVERITERLGGFFSVKDGNLVIAKKGAGAAPSGAALTPIVITPAILTPGSARIRFSDRTQYKSVKASYTDRKKGEKVDVEEESDAKGEAVYRLSEQYADETEAKKAAKSKAGDLLRRQATFSCQIIGNPAARAGAPLTFAGCRPGVDGLPFLIGTATHAYSKSGYTTSLDGDSQKGQTAA